MNEEFKAKVNFYLQQNEVEKALSLLNRYREDTPEFQQLENLCLSKLAEAHLHLIKEYIQNNKIEEAKALIVQFRASFGTNEEIEQLEAYVSQPRYILKLKILSKRLLDKLRSTSIISALKLLLIYILLYILVVVTIILVDPENFVIYEQKMIVPLGILSLLVSLIINYIFQYRITQRRLLNIKYYQIETVCVLIIGIIFPPLFLLYLYLFGYPIWKKTMLIGLCSGICLLGGLFIEESGLAKIGFIGLIIYVIMLYITAKKYNQ